MNDRLDTPLSDADPKLRDLLVSLAEQHIDNPARPCCDAETTLRDWVDSGLYADTQTEGRSSMRQRSTCQACGNLIEQETDGKWVDPNEVGNSPGLCLLNEPQSDEFGPHIPNLTVAEATIGLVRRQYASDRDDVKKNLRRELDALASLTDSVRKSVETEDRYDWWANHPQGLGYSAGKVERLINQLITWDRAIVDLRDCEQYIQSQATEA